MMLKLSKGEQASIDLILDRVLDRVQDRSMNAVRATMPLSSSVQSSSAPTTGAVQQILGLLGTMPAEEPAADLVTRTLAFIDRTAAAVHPSVSSSQSASNPVLAAWSAHPQQ